MRRLKEILARMEAIQTELREIETLEEASDDGLTEEQVERVSELATEWDTLEEERQPLQEREERLEEIKRTAIDHPERVIPGDGNVPSRTAPVPGITNNDPFDLSDMRFNAPPSELRGRAVTAVEQVRAVSDQARQDLTEKLEQGLADDNRGVLSRLVLHTSSDDYRSAWAKLQTQWPPRLTPDEERALQSAEEFRTAFGLTQSGYAVPAVVDPTVVLSSDGVVNPIRGLARVETITANSFKPITSAGASFSYDAALAEVSDDTPTFAQPEITCHKAQGFIQGDISAIEDWTRVEAELMKLIADGKNTLEATKFVSGAGDGSNEPFGIITELDGTASELTPATAETFAIADVYSTIEAVPPRWRSSPKMATLAELSTINAMRKFGTAVSHAFLTDLGGGQPKQLLGYNLHEQSTMAAHSAINPAASADHFILLSGDFEQYVIVDRVGLSVQFVPVLFNTANNLPDGRSGWYLHWRNGAESIVDGAFRVMNIVTTA